MRPRPIPVAEYNDTANPANEVSKTILLLKTSATNEIPKGASQTAACKVRMLPVHTFVNRSMESSMATALPEILMIRSETVFCQKNKATMAVKRWTSTGKMSVLSVIYLLPPVCLNHQGHRN